MSELDRIALKWKEEGWRITAPEIDSLISTSARYRQQLAEANARVKELEAENARLREALQFYANPVVYQPDSVGRLDDLTSFAQKALNQKGGE
jgi:exonuclease VII small subunit